ncbi:hypothetical protein [Pedobacter glucosidilyticus]|uniref:hypothetical protein n=1 Tax=Pedobacter glucosidilyticus TaxID=1122941 RepID=UPI0026EE81F0|nr:hypothetical protein [Pedobacter glucosidilyticus]
MKYLITVCLLICWLKNESLAQHLHQKLSLHLKEKTVEQALEELSLKGNFSFSYDGQLLQKDSLISIKVSETYVWQILDQLFAAQVSYKETGKHIILRPAQHRFHIVAEEISATKNQYKISGYVLHNLTGKGVAGASVYEKKLLQSSLTHKDGYFRMRFRGNHPAVVLTASKENYKDTSMIFLADIAVAPEGYQDKNTKSSLTMSSVIERTGINRLLLSSKRGIQSLNIPDFFANSPFQASLIPGIGSQGIMSSQVINKASLNLIGGYTAGVDGVEVGGVFNITKGSVAKVQVAGVFNAVGGSLNGVQVAGVTNFNLDTIHGVQVAGVCNYTPSAVSGVQIAGVSNYTPQNLAGVQIAGLSNIVLKQVEGTQIAGLININAKSIQGTQISGLGNISFQQVNGTQISGLFNYAKQLNGVQIGLFNLAGSSTGYSIGLFNFFKDGYHKVELTADEILNTQLSFKTGNANLYTFLLGATHLEKDRKAFAAGLGMGHDFRSLKKLQFSLMLSSKVFFTGNDTYFPILNKISLQPSFPIIKNLRAFAGPSFNFLYDDNQQVAQGYKTISPAYASNLNSHIKTWVGWNIGLTFF